MTTAQRAQAGYILHMHKANLYSRMGDTQAAMYHLVLANKARAISESAA